MKTVILGGAGYIGSVTAKLLREAGHKVYIVDNFTTGHERHVIDFTREKLDIRHTTSLLKLFKSLKPDVILHFAAKIQVEESMKKPIDYFENNVLGTANIIEAMCRVGLKNLVFSSSAAVYGEPKHIPISENDPTVPVNPYGLSKLMAEQILGSYENTHSINWIAFRYFNAAGSYKGSAMDYPVMTHLIPHAVEATIRNRPFVLYGNDYATKDGTCVRDFVHVKDIAMAHVNAAEAMHAGNNMKTSVNLGSGAGYSILQVLEALQRITGHKLKINIKSRRIGDPAQLIADCAKAKILLGWQAQETLNSMISSHWQWRTNSSKGT